MGIERGDFVSGTLDEERTPGKGKLVTLRLNAEEAALLEKQKAIFDTPSDGTIIKMLWLQRSRVLHDEFGEDWLKWLSRRDRSRLYPPKW